MQTVNIHEAKTQLSRLIEQAVKGDSFIIAKKQLDFLSAHAVEIIRDGDLPRHETEPSDLCG